MTRVSAEGCFLETSAQILRLLNRGEIGRGIESDAELFPRVATSHFVIEEFENVACRLYEVLATAFEKLPNQNRPSSFSDLLSAAEQLLPFYVPGGPKLLMLFAASLATKFSIFPVTAKEISNYIEGQRNALYESFFIINDEDLRVNGSILDRSSCCTWTLRICEYEPRKSCQLKSICLDHKDRFLQSAHTLSRAGREESKWLREHLPQIALLESIDFMEAIGKNPGPFGDLVIFWEVPSGWCTLTRDKTYTLLKEKHRSDIMVWRVRLPRIRAEERCYVTSDGVPQDFEAVLRDYTATGVGIESSSRLGDISDIINVESETLGRRTGKIVRVDQKDSATFYGIQLTRSQAQSVGIK